MTTTPLLHRRPSPAKLARARQAAVRASKLQAAQLSDHQFEVRPELAGLLPSGGLQAGSTYSVTGSTALLAALLAAPSTAGLWCAVVGLPDFAAEAASELGCDLEHLVMVPDPGADWVNLVATLADALPIVVARPLGRVSHAESGRLAARLRQRQGVLIATGDWPRCDLTLRVRRRQWLGLGAGHGRLVAQRLRVHVDGRGLLTSGVVGEQVSDVWLPADDGSVRVERLARAERTGPHLIEAAG